MYRDLPLEQALNAVGEVVFMTDVAGVFTFVNREFERLYGYSAPEVVGRCTPRILKSGLTATDDYATWWARLNRGESIRQGFVNRTRDGRLVEVEISASALRTDLQSIVGFLAVQRDITTQSEGEAALKRSEERYRALAETATDDIFIVDRENRFEYVNAAAAHHFGSPSPIGRRVEECFGPEVGPALEQQIDQVRLSGESVYGERQLRFPTGTRWLGTWLHSIGTVDRPTGSLMGIARDITKQHELASLLQRQNLLLNSIIAASPIGIALFNAETWICEIANEAVRSFGASRLTTGVQLADGWPEAVERLVPILEQVLRSEESVHTDIGLPDARGQSEVLRRFTVTGSRFQLPHGLPSVLVMLTEITERVLLGEQLLQAQKMEAIGRLAGGIAHDFNNMLTPILGYTELVLNTFEAKDRRRADLDEVCRAAKSAGALTRQLLTFSRKQVSEPVVLNLNAVLDDLEKMVRRSIGEDVDVVVHHAADLGSIRTDRNQLEQVVMNLSVNARDAMPDGGVLTITTANRTLTESERGARRQIPPGPYVVLSIADTGAGMTPDVLSHLFEPFFTTKEFGKGTGLGLSTVYGIVSQSGGYVSVASALRDGTTFTIYFPRIDAEASAQEESQILLTGELPTGHETILLVEDNGGLRRLADRVLTDLGYRTLVASDAEQALSMSREYREPIHLLLTDVVMPGADGVTLSRRLAVQQPNTRTLFMSGYSGQDLAERHAQTGRKKLLQKPFTRVTLARAVREALDVDISKPASSPGDQTVSGSVASAWGSDPPSVCQALA